MKGERDGDFDGGDFDADDLEEPDEEGSVISGAENAEEETETEDENA